MRKYNGSNFSALEEVFREALRSGRFCTAWRFLCSLYSATNRKDHFYRDRNMKLFTLFVPGLNENIYFPNLYLNISILGHYYSMI